MEQLRQMFQPQGRSMMVTPREVDQMVERGAKLISMAINLALQPDLSAEEITYLLA
jgi:spore protease